MKNINFDKYNFKASNFYRKHQALLDAYNAHPNLKNPLTRTRFAASIYVEYNLLAPWYDSVDELIADCHKDTLFKQLTGPVGLRHSPERGANISTLISGMGNLPLQYWAVSLMAGVLTAAYSSSDPISTGGMVFLSTQAAGFGVSKILTSAGENSANDRLDQILPELRAKMQ